MRCTKCGTESTTSSKFCARVWQSDIPSLFEVRRGKCALIGVLRGVWGPPRWSRGIWRCQFTSSCINGSQYPRHTGAARRFDGERR